MTNKKAGRWLVKIAASLLFLLLMTAYVEAAQQQVVMKIEGMGCGLCSLAIKRSLKEVKGVGAVKVSFGEKKAWVTVDEAVKDAALTDAVKNVGPYKAKIIKRSQTK